MGLIPIQVIALTIGIMAGSFTSAYSYATTYHEYPVHMELVRDGTQNILGIVSTPTPTPLPPTPTPTPTNTPTPTPKPTRTPTPTTKPTPTPTPYPLTPQMLDDWFTQYANHYSIDRHRLRMIAICESKLRPYAVNGPYVGMYQFGPATWRATRMRMNMDPDLRLRLNPEESIKTAAYKISVEGSRAWPNCQDKL